MYMGAFPGCLNTTCMAGASRYQKRTLDLLELEFKMPVSLCGGLSENHPHKLIFESLITKE